MFDSSFLTSNSYNYPESLSYFFCNPGFEVTETVDMVPHIHYPRLTTCEHNVELSVPFQIALKSARKYAQVQIHKC